MGGGEGGSGGEGGGGGGLCATVVNTCTCPVSIASWKSSSCPRAPTARVVPLALRSTLYPKSSSALSPLNCATSVQPDCADADASASQEYTYTRPSLPLPLCALVHPGSPTASTLPSSLSATADPNLLASDVEPRSTSRATQAAFPSQSYDSTRLCRWPSPGSPMAIVAPLPLIATAVPYSFPVAPTLSSDPRISHAAPCHS